MKKPYTLQEVTSMGGNARAQALTKSERVSIASIAAKARWAKHQDRKSFKKWAQKGQRTMTETKERIERRKAKFSKSPYRCNVGINNTKGDPYKLSNTAKGQPRFGKHT